MDPLRAVVASELIRVRIGAGLDPCGAVAAEPEARISVVPMLQGRRDGAATATGQDHERTSPAALSARGAFWGRL